MDVIFKVLKWHSLSFIYERFYLLLRTMIDDDELGINSEKNWKEMYFLRIS